MEAGGAVLLDVRNHYEFAVGHFEGAVRVGSPNRWEWLPTAAREVLPNTGTQLKPGQEPAERAESSLSWHVIKARSRKIDKRCFEAFVVV